MRKTIGIVGEGPTDYLVIKEVIEHISGGANEYKRLQPETDMMGRFGNGWKGVWKWCETTAAVLDEYFYEITPKLDLLVIQMDADVSRKEKEAHCFCGSAECESRIDIHPLTCKKIIKGQCPIALPCEKHTQNPKGYEAHLENLIKKWLGNNTTDKNILITIPCDSTDAWIVAAYQDCDNVEKVENPWENVIAKKKEYHGIRIRGNKKNISVYRQLLPRLRQDWETVTKQCYSAKSFENKIKNFLNATD